MKVWSLIAKNLEDTGCCAMVTMTEVLGSAPREAGTRMVIRPDGGFHGTIGGGTLEWRAQADAQKLMHHQKPLLNFSQHALGPELGQCCGGAVKLLIEVFAKEQLEHVRELAVQEETGPFSTRGYYTDDRVIREVTDEIHQELNFDTNGDILENFGEKKRQVYLYGAGHIGRALMLNMAALPFDLVWIDSRHNALPPITAGNVEKVYTPTPVETLVLAPNGAFIVIMTHSHSLDLDLVNAALAAERFAYVGVIGSSTKKARFKSRLKSFGMENRNINKLICPIGIDGIKSKHPAAIAASVTAELLIKDEEISKREAVLDSNNMTDLNRVEKTAKFVQ
ncbi:xanthine dehydrogenase accessory protein XdhC [Kiloniella sp. EL199]|uniref:xanthine dehydrogenase accessory protein XdhC n=1 Tax=Kiloniella sp. EL199 TaxID=2107581 RepID=UPI000EA340E3|nr:xanthine dehydrogenase accessory protein XdhC [Kiloniella sp. EL199]